MPAFDVVAAMREKVGNAHFVEGLRGVEAHDVSAVPMGQVLYIADCHDCTINVTARVVKLMVDNCERCVVHVRAGIITSTLEVWNCRELTVDLAAGRCVNTVQVDMCRAVTLRMGERACMESIVWSKTEDITFAFIDEEDSRHNTTTGASRMKALLDSVAHNFDDVVNNSSSGATAASSSSSSAAASASSGAESSSAAAALPTESQKLVVNVDTDQFITRFVDGRLQSELCVRLANGQMSTERESRAWDEQEARKRTAMAQHLQGAVRILAAESSKARADKAAKK